MDFQQLDQKIIVTPYANHDYFLTLKKNNPTLDFKLITKEDLSSNIEFTIDPKAVIHLLKQGYDLDYIDEIMHVLYPYQKGISNKVDQISFLFEQLQNENYIEQNDIYKNLFTNKKVLVFDYSELDKELIRCLKKINVSYEFVKNENKFIHSVYQYQDLKSEVNGFFIEVAKLVLDGVDLKDIALVRPSSDYNLELKKFQELYQIKIESLNSLPLTHYSAFKQFIIDLSLIGFEEAFKKHYSNLSFNLQKAFDGLLNSYLEVKDLNLDDRILKQYICYKAKKIKVKETKYDKEIPLINITEYPNYKYIFILGFNLGAYPKIHKDDQYFTDLEKVRIGLNTSSELNQIENEKIINCLNNNPHVYLSYKKEINKQIFFKSLLIDQLQYEVIDQEECSTFYSNRYMNLRLAKSFDVQKDYDIYDKFYNVLSKEKINYKAYDHSFKRFTFDPRLDSLSYTGINNYNQCAFSYYCQKILKTSIFEDSFQLKLGRIIHSILEHETSSENIDFNKYIEKENFTPKEQVLFDNLKHKINEVVDFNQEFMKQTQLKKLFKELDIKCSLNGVEIVGTIDKLMLDENNKTMVVIDYKTGQEKFDPKLVEFGFKLQLPIYSFLASEYFKDYHVIGLYIQPVLSKADSVFEDQLMGITIDDKKLIETIDSNYTNSKYIKEIKINSDGSFSKSSKVFSRSTIDELTQKAKEQIIEVINKIKICNFEINPKIIDANSVCKFCTMNDICFKSNKDYIYINSKEEK